MKSIGKKESKQSYLIISKTLKRHYLNIWSRLWLWAKTQLITDLNIEKMETIKPKQVIKYPTNVPSTFHKHSWLQTVSIKNACKWNVENKSYQALFQRGLLELQVRNASIQESTETEKKKISPRKCKHPT